MILLIKLSRSTFDMSGYLISTDHQYNLVSKWILFFWDSRIIDLIKQRIWYPEIFRKDFSYHYRSEIIQTIKSIKNFTCNSLETHIIYMTMFRSILSSESHKNDKHFSSSSSLIMHSQIFYWTEKNTMELDTYHVMQ